MPGGYNAGSVYAEASLDISKFKAAAAQMGGDTGKIVAAMDKAASGLAKAQSSLEQLRAGYDAAKSSAAAAESTFKSSASVLEEMNLKAEAAAIKAAALGNAYEAAQSKFGDASLQAKEASDAYNEAASEADKLIAAVEKQENVVAKNKASFDKAVASVKKFESKISDTEEKISDFNDKLDEMNSQLTSGMMENAASDMDSASIATAVFQDVLENVSDKGLSGLGSALSSAVGKLDIFKDSTGLVNTALNAVKGAISPIISGLSTSTLGFLAVGAAAAYGAYKLIDYATGAAAAREAQEKLNETAKEWSESDITTSYEKSAGMGGYGLSESDFAPSAKSSQNWLNTVTKVWSDGKKETNEIVREMVSGFTTGTDEMRESLTGLQQSAEKAGVGDTGIFGDLDADIARLDAIDKEVESLLKKKQNGTLSENDVANLQSLYDERGAIQVKYHLTEDDTSGFEQIQQSVESAMSRGGSGADVWADAYASASQGIQAYTDSLNAEYDAQYKTISMIEDKNERLRALGELQQWYNEQAAAGQEKYGQTLQSAADMTGAFSEGGAYADQMNKLAAALAAMREAGDGSNEHMAAFSSALSELDETQVVEMTAALTSMDQAGVELSGGMASALEAITSLKAALESDVFKGNEDLYASLDQMFGENLDNEVLEINASLNTEALNAIYDAWAAGKHADIIPSINTETIDLSELDSLEGTVTAIHQGESVTVDLSTIDELAGTVTVVNSAGKQTTVKISELENLEGTVTAYTESGSITFAASALSQLDGTVAVLVVTPEAIEKLGTIKFPGEVEFSEGAYKFTNSKDPQQEYIEGEQRKSQNFLGLTDFTASGTYKQLENMAQAVRDYNAALAEYDAASADFNTNGTPESFMRMQELEPVIANCASSIATIGDSLGNEAGYNGGMGFEAMAQMIANGFQLLSNGELDPADTEKLTGIITDLQTVLSSDLAADSSWADNLGVSFQEGLSNAFNNNEGWSTTADNVLTTITGAFGAASAQMNAVGGDLSSGIGDGMANQDMSGYAATTITKTESSLRDASDSHSPAGITKPLGRDISAGIGVGMMQYEFASSAAGVASKIRSALQQKLTAASMRSIGKFAMLGLAAGITSGTSSVTSAMRIAAQKAVRAAKAALEIKSPSHVFRDEVGVMMMRGIGDGVLGEAKNQARIIGNAAKYMTGEARSAVMAAPMNDNRRTYNDSSSVNVYVDHLSAQDQHSIFELANEIAALTRRQQQGRGNRKA